MAEDSSHFPSGVTLNEKSVQSSTTLWIIDVEGAPGALYEGEKFQLLFQCSSPYPFDSPQVMFTGVSIPGSSSRLQRWSCLLLRSNGRPVPALSVQSACLGVVRVLPSCKEKRWPPANSFYVQTCHKSKKKPKQNGGVMMLIDATTVILLREDSPTAKTSTLIIQSLDCNLWKWPIGNENDFLLRAFRVHADRWVSSGD